MQCGFSVVLPWSEPSVSKHTTYTHLFYIMLKILKCWKCITIITCWKIHLTSSCLKSETKAVFSTIKVFISWSVLPWTSICPAVSSSCWPGSPGWAPYCRIVAPGCGVAGLGRVSAWTPCRASPPGPASCIAPPWVNVTAQTQNNKTVSLESPQTPVITR